MSPDVRVLTMYLVLYCMMILFCIFGMASSKKHRNTKQIRQGFAGTRAYYEKLFKSEPVQVLIVGSGPAGLVLAAGLAKQSKVVAVLEQNKLPGGGLHTFSTSKGTYATGLHYVGKTLSKAGFRKHLNHCTEGKSIPFAPRKLLRKKASMALFRARDIGCDFPVSTSFLKENSDECYTEEQKPFAMNPRAYDFVSFDAGKTFFPFQPGQEDLQQSLQNLYPQDAGLIDKYFVLVKHLNNHPEAERFFKLKCVPWFSNSTLKHLQKIFCRDFLKYAQKTVTHVLEEEIGIARSSPLFAILTSQFGNYGTWPDESSFYIHAATVGHYFNGSVFPVGGPDAIVQKLIQSIRHYHSAEKPKKDVFCNVKVLGVDYGCRRDILSNLQRKSNVLKHWWMHRPCGLDQAKNSHWLQSCLESVFPFLVAKNLIVHKRYNQKTFSDESDPLLAQVPFVDSDMVELVPVAQNVVFATSSSVATQIVSSKLSLLSLSECVAKHLCMDSVSKDIFLKTFFETFWYNRDAENHREILGKSILSGTMAPNSFSAEIAVSKKDDSSTEMGFFYAFITLSSDYPHTIPLANVWEHPFANHDQVKRSYVQSQEKGLDCDPVLFLSAKSTYDDDRQPPVAHLSKKSFCVLVPVLLRWFDEWKGMSPDKRRNSPSYCAWKEDFWNKIKKSKTLEKFAPNFSGFVVDVVTGTPLSSITYLGSRYGNCYGIPASTERFGVGFDNIMPRTAVRNMFLSGQDVVTAGLAGAVYSAQITEFCIVGVGYLISMLALVLLATLIIIVFVYYT